MQVSSGWLKLDNMVLRVKSVAGTKIVLEAFDTTDTTKFPAGTGAGTLRKVDSWITMPQVMTLSTEGGDQQTISVQFLEDDKARTIPTFKNAVVQVYTFAHDPQLAIYKRLIDWMTPATQRRSGSITHAARRIVITLPGFLPARAAHGNQRRGK